VKSFLLKGRVADFSTDKQLDPQGYFDPAQLAPEARPLELLPFFDVSHQHFLSADVPMPDTQSATDHRIVTFAMHPHMSFTGFQHQIMVAARNGTVMKWNSNVTPSKFQHETRYRLYGQLYGESKVAQDLPFPGNKIEAIAAA
jgi:hypothetical protein